MGSCFSKVFSDEDREQLLSPLAVEEDTESLCADSIERARFLLALQSGVDHNDIPDEAAELFMKGGFVCVQNYKALRDSIDNFRTHADKDKLLAEANNFFCTSGQENIEYELQPLSML